MPSTRALPRDSWARYLADLTAERRGAPVVVAIDWESLGEEVEAHDVLLESLSYDAHDDEVALTARRPSPTRPTILRHVVSRPRSVEVDSRAGILPRELRIEGDDGARTVITITPQPAASS